ncbi:MAG: acetylornithine transaminase [Propionibacteriaceae bacterium]|jgi:acetylornithine aminotransferase|nr:acetylornithine transaminase [Propionibacteriaceae bacterium]
MNKKSQTETLAGVDSASEIITQRYQQVMMNTFGAPQRVFVRGEGVYLWDAEDNKYLDLLAGIAVNVLGHAHPKVVEAVSAQLATLGHVSNFFATGEQVALAGKLIEFATANDPGRVAKVFFANSGTEANEAGLKLTRMTGRKKIIAMEGAFHGRSMGALALTWNKPYREPFEPLPGIVEFVPYGNSTRLARIIDDSVAAVIVEPIQGENGIVVPDDGYLAEVRKITQKAGALLWLDEIQTGMGRTGTWLASQPSGVTADIVTLAKGLGNGFPMGACVATGAAADLLGPGSHGSTFGGNPVAAAAGLATIKAVERQGLMKHAVKLAARLETRIEKLNLFEVESVRGRGLLCGIVLRPAIAADVARVALDAGFVINAPRPNVLRLAPPLIITAKQLDTFIDALPELIKAAR